MHHFLSIIYCLFNLILHDVVGGGNLISINGKFDKFTDLKSMEVVKNDSNPIEIIRISSSINDDDLKYKTGNFGKSAIDAEDISHFLSIDKKSDDEDKLLTQNILNAVFQENVRILKLTTYNDDSMSSAGDDDTISSLFYVDDVLSVPRALTTTTNNNQKQHNNKVRKLPLEYYSDANKGLTGRKYEENATRCEYSADLMQYRQLHISKYTIKVRSKWENIDTYTNLKRLYFNCYRFELCCQLECCQMSDQQIIAKKFVLLATMNASSETKSAQLSIDSVISHRDSQFSLISPPIDDDEMNVKTIDNHNNNHDQVEHSCIFDVKSSTIFAKYFDGVHLDDGRSIDTIYELFRTDKVAIDQQICGQLCCEEVVTVAPPTDNIDEQLEPAVDSDQTNVSKWQIDTLLIIALFSGVILIAFSIIAVVQIVRKHLIPLFE